MLIKSGAETWHHIVHLYTFYIIEEIGDRRIVVIRFFIFFFYFHFVPLHHDCRIYIRYCRLLRFLNNLKLVTVHFTSILYYIIVYDVRVHYNKYTLKHILTIISFRKASNIGKKNKYNIIWWCVVLYTSSPLFLRVRVDSNNGGFI